MKSAALLALVPASMAFINTGYFAINEAIDGMDSYNFGSDAQAVQQIITQVIKEACNNSEKKVIIHNVPFTCSFDFAEHTFNFDGSKEVTQIENVYYNSAKLFQYDYFEKTCPVSAFKFAISEGDLSDEEAAEIVDSFEQSDKLILIIDYKVGCGFASQKFSLMYISAPSFEAPQPYGEIKLDSIEHFIEEKVYDNFNIELDLDMGFDGIRREDVEYEEEMELKVESDFEAVEEFIKKEGFAFNSELYTQRASADANSDSGSLSVFSSNKTTRTAPNNLFTHYQFFTPGVLLGLIVSSLLIYFVYVAISWITALEISYKSFDKQIDFEKKNE